ncbi:3-methyl-2-oxobutanoate hydroxymethyltransferase [Spongorhabdus nitratireducens]
MPKVTLNTLASRKAAGEKFTCLTAYDATVAHLLDEQGVEVLLVGDSLGMVMQGKDSTVHVSMDDIEYHTRCVSRGVKDTMIMSDMPFMSASTEEKALENATRLMQAGAEIVKIEGDRWLLPAVKTMAERGIPVCVHLGLLPQLVSILGGYKVQGRDVEQATAMIQLAKEMEQAGAVMLLLECVPSDLARELTQTVSIPVIGIGAGKDTDAQVLVTQDMLNLTPGRKAKFVRNFMEGASSVQDAVGRFVSAVKSGEYPAPEHSY